MAGVTIRYNSGGIRGWAWNVGLVIRQMAYSFEDASQEYSGQGPEENFRAVGGAAVDEVLHGIGHHVGSGGCSKGKNPGLVIVQWLFAERW